MSKVGSDEFYVTKKILRLGGQNVRFVIHAGRKKAESLNV